MDIIINWIKRYKSLIKFLLFLFLFTISFLIFFGTIKYTLPFLIGLIVAALLKKPTTFLIKKCKIKNSIATTISTLLFYIISITIISYGIFYLCTEIKDIAYLGYNYIAKNTNVIEMNIQDILLKFNNIDPSIIETIMTNFTNSLSDFSTIVLNGSLGFVNSLISIVSSLPYITSVIIFAIISTFVFLKEMNEYKYSDLESSKYYKYINIGMEIKDSIFKYISTFATLVFMTFAQTFLAFSIMNIPYALLLSILCMMLDLLPIVGTIIVFIPLIIIHIYTKKYLVAIMLGIVYVLLLVIRNILEPKMLSSSLEISPISILISIFVGLNLAGFKGMIYLISLFIGINLYKKYNNIN